VVGKRDAGRQKPMFKTRVQKCQQSCHLPCLVVSSLSAAHIALCCTSLEAVG
jgi:hypothetical protein